MYNIKVGNVLSNLAKGTCGLSSSASWITARVMNCISAPEKQKLCPPLSCKISDWAAKDSKWWTVFSFWEVRLTLAEDVKGEIQKEW